MSDLSAMAATTSGKIEVEAFEDGSEGKIISALIRSAVHTTFIDAVDPGLLGPIVEAFDSGETVDVGPGVASEQFVHLVKDIPSLQPAIDALLEDDDIDHANPAVVASAVELILEGLHLGKRLNKNDHGDMSQYRGRS